LSTLGLIALLIELTPVSLVGVWRQSRSSETQSGPQPRGSVNSRRRGCHYLFDWPGKP